MLNAIIKSLNTSFKIIILSAKVKKKFSLKKKLKQLMREHHRVLFSLTQIPVWDHTGLQDSI